MKKRFAILTLAIVLSSSVITEPIFSQNTEITKKRHKKKRKNKHGKTIVLNSNGHMLKKTCKYKSKRQSSNFFGM